MKMVCSVTKAELTRCLVQVAPDGARVVFWPDDQAQCWTVTGDDAAKAITYLNLTLGGTCIGWAAQVGHSLRASPHTQIWTPQPETLQ
jgi:hypothetical protein